MEMQTVAQLGLVAFLIESIWETLKMTYENDKINIDRIGVLVAGIVIALFFNVDLFGQLGLTTSIPYVSLVLSGIMLSRGSNFVHDVFKKIQG